MAKVHIEFQRVQTWLFAVPKLRAMVGANTLLGEALRKELPELARGGPNWSLASVDLDCPIDPNDPLRNHDAPEADAKDGILSRDGGHFEANFSTGAEAFAAEAAALLRDKVPDLRFRIRIDNQEWTQPSTQISLELPVLARCEWMGRGLASSTVVLDDEPAEVAIEVHRRQVTDQRAKEGRACDLASLLTARTNLAKLEQARDFDKLAGNGYLALIHADGNDVGKGTPKEEDNEKYSYYYRNRVMLRRALHSAINYASEQATTAPLVLLMLGGDDLLIVCRASAALPFAVNLCKELEAVQQPRSNDAFHLTLGIGVVISKPKAPIHRLHEIATELAASSKRRFRGFQDEQASVADWAVYTTSMLDATEEVRKRDWVRGAGAKRRILSCRPLRVLGNDDDLTSLSGLLNAKKHLNGASRSQLRYFADQVHRGKTLAELAFEEMSEDTRKALKDAGLREVWTSRRDAAVPWLTSALDLIEVYEIDKLGKAKAVGKGSEA